MHGEMMSERPSYRWENKEYLLEVFMKQLGITEEDLENEAAAESDSDSEPEEVFIVDIKDKGQFYTTDEQNGDIYEILVDSNDDIGEKIGKFKNGKAMFF